MQWLRPTAWQYLDLQPEGTRWHTPAKDGWVSLVDAAAPSCDPASPRLSVLQLVLTKALEGLSAPEALELSSLTIWAYLTLAKYLLLVEGVRP